MLENLWCFTFRLVRFLSVDCHTRLSSKYCRKWISWLTDVIFHLFALRRLPRAPAWSIMQIATMYIHQTCIRLASDLHQKHQPTKNNLSSLYNFRKHSWRLLVYWVHVSSSIEIFRCNNAKRSDTAWLLIKQYSYNQIWSKEQSTPFVSNQLLSI